MKFHKTAVVAAAALALAAAACGKEGSPADKSTSSGGSPAPKLPTYQVNTGAHVHGSAAFDRMSSKGKITIGVKADQPYLGFEDANTGERSGFDIEIAKMVAADLGFGSDKITYKTIASQNRETAIAGGQIDLYVGTYTINDERKKQVSFAGPYYIAAQDLLVKKGSNITGPDDLKGKKVCSATGSTPLQRIKEPKYGAKVSSFDTYSQCVQNLIGGQVDAVTTDDAILKGYAAQNAGLLKVVGSPFSTEPYGIGLAKNDKALRSAVNDALEAHETNGDWKKAYDATLGLSGSPASEPPALQRY